MTDINLFNLLKSQKSTKIKYNKKNHEKEYYDIISSDMMCSGDSQ